MLAIEAVVRAKSIDEAFSAMDSDPELKPIAGGTDLMVQLQDAPSKRRLLDIWGIPELRGIHLESQRLFIGALETHSEIAKSEIVQTYAPLIAQSSAVMGGPAIRNRATIGGNIANSSPVAESFPTLIAHGAKVVLMSHRGERRLAIEDFHLGPGKNALSGGELVIGFEVPIVGKEFFGFYKRLGSREAMTITKVGVAMASVRRSNRLEGVRIALSAVAPRVIRAFESEKILKGREISSGLIDRAAGVLVTECTPISDFRSTCDYRADMVGQLFRIGMNGE